MIVVDFLIWFARVVFGGLIIVIGLAVFGVDFSKVPLWQSCVAFLLLSIGFTIMPPLPSKAEGKGWWKKKPDILG